MAYSAYLAHLRVIEIAGVDAGEFLSNQFTNDITAIKAGEIRQSAWCDPKGRVLFAPLLAKHPEAYHCLVAEELAAKFCQRLKMFVLRANVSIEPLNDLRVLCVHSESEPSTDIGEHITPNLTAYQFITFLSADENATTAYVLGEPQALEDLESTLGLQRDNNRWQRDQIAKGLVEISELLSGKFLPQNLNFDATNVVSFQKGCYPGQEIIARVKYRGSVKQRLYRLHSSDALPEASEVAPLTRVVMPDKPESKIGQVLVSQYHEGQLFCLAVIDVGIANNCLNTANEIVQLGDSKISAAVVLPPYSLPE